MAELYLLNLIMLFNSNENFGPNCQYKILMTFLPQGKNNFNFFAKVFFCKMQLAHFFCNLIIQDLLCINKRISSNCVEK